MPAKDAAPRHAAHHEQADATEHGADEQQAKRIDSFDDRAGEEPQHEHQAGGVHQQQDAVRDEAFHDVGDPTVGSQFDVADEGVQNEQEQQHGRGELGQHFAEA